MVEMRYEVDVDEIERGIMKPMLKKPGLGKDLRSDVRCFIEEMLKAWETFVTLTNSCSLERERRKEHGVQRHAAGVQHG